MLLLYYYSYTITVALQLIKLKKQGLNFPRLHRKLPYSWNNTGRDGDTEKKREREARQRARKAAGPSAPPWGMIYDWVAANYHEAGPDTRARYHRY